MDKHSTHSSWTMDGEARIIWLISWLEEEPSGICYTLSEHKRKRHQYYYLRHLIAENAYANFSDPLLDLDIAMHDYDISLEVPVPSSEDQVADPDHEAVAPGNEATNADTDENKEWGSNDAGGSTLSDKVTNQLQPWRSSYLPFRC